MVTKQVQNSFEMTEQEKMDLNEARKNLEAALGEDLKRQYFVILKQWFSLNNSITKLQFDQAVRKIMVNEEQLHCHNMFLFALLLKSSVGLKRIPKTAISDKGNFEMAEFADYLSPSSPSMTLPQELEYRSAASEMFLPDITFIQTRISVNAWEHGLNGADAKTAELLVLAVQMFLKNILTAMISRKKGYKNRDGKFQHGIGFPVPDPFLRNSYNIVDLTQESRVDVAPNDDILIPSCRYTLENAEQRTAFAYSCGAPSSSSGKLTLRLLYDTLKEDASVISCHSVHAINLERILMQLEPNSSK